MSASIVMFPATPLVKRAVQNESFRAGPGSRYATSDPEPPSHEGEETIRTGGERRFNSLFLEFAAAAQPPQGVKKQSFLTLNGYCFTYLSA